VIGPRIRILVVDDSLTVRKRLVEILSSDPAIEVVAEAGDGKAAIELCERLRPDAITLDMMLPVMTGVAVTEYIMAFCPTPILIVSASTNRGELFRTYDALAAGAIDVLEKQPGDRIDGEWERELVSRIKMVARIPVITHPRARLGRVQRVEVDVDLERPPAAPAEPGTRVVAIGASTGGPAAVLEVLRALPSEFPVPLVIVIHIGEAFGSALPSWLADQVGRPVRYPGDGMPLSPGSRGVFLAPPGNHLVVERGRLRLSMAPERHSCRPSIDLLFESIAAELCPGAIACLLTGMGRDGAEGLLAIRRAGGETIAQDQATSIVFGMPGEAVRLGAARYVLPLPEIAPAIHQLAARGKYQAR
jgi:two-component system chemotaxis response regulator CheB